MKFCEHACFTKRKLKFGWFKTQVCSPKWFHIVDWTLSRNSLC